MNLETRKSLFDIVEIVWEAARDYLPTLAREAEELSNS